MSAYGFDPRNFSFRRVRNGIFTLWVGGWRYLRACSEAEVLSRGYAIACQRADYFDGFIQPEPPVFSLIVHSTSLLSFSLI